MNDFLNPGIIPLALMVLLLVRLLARAKWGHCLLFGFLGGGALFQFIDTAVALMR